MGLWSSVLFLGAAMLTLGGTPVLAQTGTFFTVTYIEVAATTAGQAANQLKIYRDTSRRDHGAVRFEVVQRLDRPNQFTVLAVWNNQQSYEAHTQTPHAKALHSTLSPTLLAPSDTRQHIAISIGEIKIQRGANVTAVTHVDVIPPQKDNGVAALETLAEESRKHFGNLRFDVWQQTNRPNHFTVIETWANRPNFDSHAGLIATKHFRDKLAIMTGALYDERLYRILD